MMRAAFLFALLFPITAVAEDTAPWLGAEIETCLIGNTIVGEAHDFFGADFKIYFHPNGTTRGVAEKFSFTVTDRGRWEIDGNKICVQWSKWEGNDRLCRTTATRAGEILMFDAEGNVTSRQTVRAGNPYDL